MQLQSMAAQRIASHCIALHCIASHRIRISCLYDTDPAEWLQAKAHAWSLSLELGARKRDE